MSYYSENREKILNKAKEYYLKNREKIIKRNSERQKGKNRIRKKIICSRCNKLEDKWAKDMCHICCNAIWASENRSKIELQKKIYEKKTGKRKIWQKTRYYVKLEGLCEICKMNKAVNRHHPDYSKPLEVIMVCAQCHSDIHRNKKLASNMGAGTK